jgi:MYXO-CTERM domain-containing protein
MRGLSFWSTWAVLLGAAACFEDPLISNDAGDTQPDESETRDSVEGDGDGDPGDGDGDPGDGDGDGDGNSGDGDGDGDSGGSGETGASAEAGAGDEGCSCSESTQAGGWWTWLAGLAVFGIRRRRAAA